MTTEPRPLPPSDRPHSITSGPKLKRFDVTRSQVVSLAETNAGLTADNARLTARVEELEADLISQRFASNLIGERNKYVEGLLASHEQQLESEQISKGTLIRDNARLRELLTKAHSAIPDMGSKHNGENWEPIEHPLKAEIRDAIK